jgi:hypothetical protein
MNRNKCLDVELTWRAREEKEVEKNELRRMAYGKRKFQWQQDRDLLQSQVRGMSR